MDAEKIIHEFPKGLLNWYNFRNDGKVLYILSKETSVGELLQGKCNWVLSVDVKQSLDGTFTELYSETFDYIVAIGILECFANPVEILTSWRKLLNPSGRMLLGMENRLGLRYFCGDRDPFTGRIFDGIDNYKRVFPADRDYIEGRNYSRDEIGAMLSEAGWEQKKLYSVLPDLKAPQLIYAEDYLPVEELAIRYFPMYHHPDSVFLEEEYLYTDLIKNGLFHAMANSYLIECSMDDTFDNVWHVTLSMDRGKENAVATIIRSDNTVEKRILYKEGYGKLQSLEYNEKDLRKHGLLVLEGNIRGNSYIMPYVDREITMVYLRRLFRTNQEEFIKEIDGFRDLILQSSEHVEGEEWNGLGVILKRGYWDLVPLNCFYDEGNYLFFDQEFYEENYPANAIIFRTLEILYAGDSQMESVLPRRYFWQRYKLEEKLGTWKKYSYETTLKLRHLKELRIFHEKMQRNDEVTNTNRQRMNYSTGEYQRIFVDLLRNAENKKIILFGAGNFTKRFLAQFQKEYQIAAIVDNNCSRWGNELEGITIQSPEFINSIPQGELRVIICVKGYAGIVRQLQQMGIDNYCIYDTNVEYPRRQEPADATPEHKKMVPKKYHIGYVAGVFDLFHIGHLNMFKRAKEQCEYLIVGVMTDEGVKNYKESKPFIPFKERMEMVKSCRYVDEVTEIPVNFGSIREAYKMHRFDCQFSGSDYMNNPDWLAEKEYLEKQGAELVFFPYTEGTSSTKLKHLIEKSLL